MRADGKCGDFSVERKDDDKIKGDKRTKEGRKDEPNRH